MKETETSAVGSSRNPPASANRQVSGEASSKEKKEHWRSGSGWQGGVGLPLPLPLADDHMPVGFYQRLWKGAGAGQGKDEKGK